jgi:hypothetical protein
MDHAATIRTTLAAFQAADDAWQAELSRVWGKNAGDIRYTPYARGDAGTELRRLYEARMTASNAWCRAKEYA